MVSEKEIKDWYNQRHSTKGENAWRPKEAYPIFLNYLDIKSGKKLLDIGCGTGFLLKEAEKRGLETYGIDISDEAVKIAKRVSPNTKIIVGKGEDIKFSDNFFDYVTCIGALEHFIDMEKGIKEIVRVGKKNALYCIVVPNINFFMWKNKDLKGTEQQEINENLLSLKQWKNIFINEDFEILKIYKDNWPITQINVFSSINPLQIMKRLILKSLWSFLPLNYTYQFIFILGKR